MNSSILFLVYYELPPEMSVFYTANIIVLSSLLWNCCLIFTSRFVVVILSCLSISSANHFSLPILSFSQQFKRFSSIFTKQQRWKDFCNENVCEERRSICSVTTLWHWHHNTKLKGCAPRQGACHTITPVRASELFLIFLVPCYNRDKNLQSLLCPTIIIQCS